MTAAGLRRPLAVLVGVLLALAPGPARAQAACPAWFNGVDAGRVGSLSTPLLLASDATLTFTGTDPLTTGRAEVAVLLGPMTLGRAVSAQAAAPEFAASLDLSAVAPYGVGLLRIRGATDHCLVEAWVRVGGRLPFTTLAGIAGTALAAAGLTGLAVAMIARRRWSPWIAAASGLLAGTGGALLGQQLGRLQVSYWSLAACTLPTAAVALGLGLLRRRGREGDAGPAPSPAAPGAEEPPPAPGSRWPAATTAAPPPEAPAPSWCYVLADTRVLHLDDYTQVVATLHPGTWYLAHREAGGWAQVEAAPGLEGWVPARALHRES